MIQKFDEYFLNESKQVGIIYHYTWLKKFYDILESNMLIAEKKHQIGKPYISFTRDKNLHNRNPFGIGQDVRIKINGDKLSNHYKINPYNDFHETSARNKNKMWVEAEERIQTKVIDNLDQYVISYEIFSYETMKDPMKRETYDKYIEDLMEIGNHKIKIITP